MGKNLLILVMLVMAVSITACTAESEAEFVGRIQEISGQNAIVLADEDQEIRRSGDLVEVNLAVNEEVEFQVGDRVKVIHEGMVQEKYPLGISTIRVELLERDENREEDLDEQEEDSAYVEISQFLEEESREAFSPYYELLEFIISDYKEEIVDGKVEAEFLYTIISKNYDRDPDTVGYIKEAKESGNENYQLMYDEYLQPREMNFDFKVVIDEEDNITLYSNIAPKGVEWEETRMTDYILKD